MQFGLGRYLKMLDGIHPQNTRCVHCGNTISIYVEYPICHFCELPGSDEAVEGSRDYQAIGALIDKRNELVHSGMWDEGLKVAEQIKSSKIPSVIYANGLVYWAFSDILYNSVDYDMEGYMEGNSDNRERSWKVLSDAKASIYKAIKMCDAKLSTGYDSEASYLKMIAHARLGGFADAKHTMEIMSLKEGITDQQFIYAGMIFYTGIGSKKTALDHINQLAKSQMNAFYYLAKIMASEKQTNDAIRVLSKISSKAYMPMANEMLVKARESMRKGL